MRGPAMTLKPLDALGSTYESINAGVHRRTASIVGIPSLIRHLGLWDVANDPNAARRPQAFTDYLAELRAVLEGGANGTIHVRKKDKVKDLPASMSAKTVRSGTIRIARFWWHGIRATIRLEFRTEYVMITSILDLSLKPCREYALPDDPDNVQRRVSATFKRLGELFNNAAEQPDSQPKPRKPTAQERAGLVERQKEYSAMARFLQYDLWKAFEKSVLDAPGANGAILGSRFGEVFADFRGVVSGSTAERRPLDELKPERRALEQNWRRHFELEPHTERTRQLEHGSPPADWARDTLRRLWPLIEPDPYLHDYEFTVSGFLAGRALFVTALGPKLPNSIKCGWEWTPVCNFIHSYTDDVWQLGRLVDRIKNLGTLRLAATVEIEPLIDSGAQVDDLIAAMHRADEAIQNEIDRRTDDGSASKATALSPDKAMTDVRGLYQLMNNSFSNDIHFRLDRADYYIDQFTRGAAALRVKRIEGFQKYDEMVQRRMSGVFSYVGLMKNRMIDVDARMSALSRAYTSLKAVETTKEIMGLVSSMKTLVSSMQDQNKQIEKIQEFGEIALIGFLIPYYLGATLFYYAFHLQGEDAALPWLVTISLFAGLVTLRSLLRMWKERRIRSTAGLTFLVSCLYILFAWFALPRLLATH